MRDCECGCSARRLLRRFTPTAAVLPAALVAAAFSPLPAASSAALACSFIAPAVTASSASASGGSSSGVILLCGASDAQRCSVPAPLCSSSARWKRRHVLRLRWTAESQDSERLMATSTLQAAGVVSDEQEEEDRDAAMGVTGSSCGRLSRSLSAELAETAGGWPVPALLPLLLLRLVSSSALPSPMLTIWLTNSGRRGEAAVEEQLDDCSESL